MKIANMGGGLLLCLALGCGGDDGGSETKDDSRSMDAGKDDGGSVVTGRGGSDIDGGVSGADGGSPDGGSADGSVDSTLDRFFAESLRAEQLECDCLAEIEGEACEEDPDPAESAKEWEAYTGCLRDGVALDASGSSTWLDCLLSVSLQHNQCLAELDSCGQDEDPFESCDQEAQRAESRCPPPPDAVNEAWDACEPTLTSFLRAP